MNLTGRQNPIYRKVKRCATEFRRDYRRFRHCRALYRPQPRPETEGPAFGKAQPLSGQILLLARWYRRRAGGLR